MPELPEVETLCRQLNAVLSDEKILRIEVLDPRLGNTAQKRKGGAVIFPGSVPKNSGLEKFAGLIGRRIEAVTRRGKYIYIEMEGGLTAALHLRMSGRLLYRPADTHLQGRTAPDCFHGLLPDGDSLRAEASGSGPGKIVGLAERVAEKKTVARKRRGEPSLLSVLGKVGGLLEKGAEAGVRETAAPVALLSPTTSSGTTGSCPPFSRLVITFSSGTLTLLDPRRFATFVVEPPAWSPPALSYDPMQGLPARRLREIARTRRLPVKSFLMDQRLIAGIGNIYACEILFASGIDPRRPACSLSAAEWRQTAKAAATILRRAVDCRGTTMSDWRDLFGCSGTNQDHLEAYSRQGAPCRRCGGGIERITQSGRGTWFCPSCQK